SGIGRALALSLGRAGARLGLLARRRERLDALIDELGPGAHALALTCDVTDDDACRRAVEGLVDRFGALDLVVNTAGVSMNGRFDETQLSVFHHMMNVNYFGSLHIARHAGPHLERSQGSLIFVSSIVGKRGFPTRSGYSASKFAVHALFESLRVEWASKGVHVGIVAPGYTDTEIRERALGADGLPRGQQGMTVGKVMSAEDAASSIICAAAKRRREVILTPGGKVMVWVNKLSGGLSDRLAARVIG
ncbi:MAG: SDR family oxidoreductase, partial [Myxococcota bacterium]|nr:SDR family oxidoreductase [Myxococcota bacterium]